MNNEFRLKDIKLNSQTHNDSNVEYTLNFSDGQTDKTISLSGIGKLRESVKI